MKAEIEILNRKVIVDLSQPIDISIPLRAGKENVNAWYCDPVKIEPVVMGDWVGDVNKGGSVNFRNIFFNPHGHGTHTECVGHISKENYTINQSLKQFFFLAKLITVMPEKLTNGDEVITLKQIQKNIVKGVQAVVIRSLPNGTDKLTKQYSNTNPPYIQSDAMQYIVDCGIDHLLIDLPSVDREQDGGLLASHHVFWQYPEHTQLHRTITEMIYVPYDVKDGEYLLNIQVASFESDASPSKPLLYRLED